MCSFEVMEPALARPPGAKHRMFKACGRLRGR
jgi:hypothetical protein